MDSLFLLTQNSGKILGPIAKVLGYLMNAIYVFMDKFLNIQNVGLTIIVFTIVIYFCLLPLTYKQQKFSKMSQIMNPEIQAIQKKVKKQKRSGIRSGYERGDTGCLPEIRCIPFRKLYLYDHPAPDSVCSLSCYLQRTGIYHKRQKHV